MKLEQFAARCAKVTEQIDRRSRADTLALVGIAAVVALVHVLTNGRYGFHRDELQVLSDARHLDWGFVPYPPLTSFVERIGLSIFGLSMVGLRMFSVISQALAVVFTGLMARWYESYLIGADVGHIPISNLYEVFVLFCLITALFYLY